MITYIDFYIYIFSNFTISLCSIFPLLPLFLFHLNFYINFLLFHFHPFPLFLPSFPRQKRSILSLSLSNFVSPLVVFLLIQPLIFNTNSSFVIVDLLVTSHLFLFLQNLYKILCTFRNFGIPILHYKFFFFISMVWFDLG